MAPHRSNLSASQKMALYSAFIEAGSASYSTQIISETARSAFELFLDQMYNEHVADLSGEDIPNQISSSDIFCFIRMDGLTNMWLGQAGRDGKYVSAVLARTVVRRSD
jgi:hypothetical protein